jgi:hypothetical protein
MAWGMFEYRIYCLDHEGRISKVHEVEADDDAAALAQARALNHSGACDVWNRDRFVGRVAGQAIA